MTITGDVAAYNIVIFVRSLRANGFNVSPQTSLHLVTAAQIVGMGDMNDVREAFKSLVVARRGQGALFDDLFDQFFSGDVVISVDSIIEQITKRTESNPSRIAVAGITDEGTEGEPEEALEVAGGSHGERLMDLDFSELSKQEAATVAEMLDAMTWSPPSVRSRRWRVAPNGSVPHLRSTMRLLTGPTGDLMPLAFTERRHKQRPLVLLADISGSMAQYSEMLLHFVHGAQHRFSGVESFVFATRLTRITRELRRRNPAEALATVSRSVPDWSGGTRIGEAIGSFNRKWSRRIGGGGRIVLIISDGWDTGDPGYLALEMRKLARTSHRVVWLNPLAGRRGFTPEARGMAAALPHVDDLLAGGTARNLFDLIELLQSDSVRGRKAAAL